MSAAGLDRAIARRIATVLAPDAGGQPSPGHGRVHEVVAEAAVHVVGYARLGDPGLVPDPQVVDRGGWIDANLATADAAAAKLAGRLGEPGLPGPVNTAAERALAAATGVQAGIALGFAGSRVLGQYRVPLFGEAAGTELLIVGPNLEAIAAHSDFDPDALLRWVALHEVTHVLQFESTPWLAPYLSQELEELFAAAGTGIDLGRVASAVGSLLRTDPRRLLAELRELEPFTLLADEGTRDRFERLQAVMSVIEGHAEHVMDAAAPAWTGDVASMRARLDARRNSRSLLELLLARLLGLEAKARQYRDGRTFVDAVVETAGIAALNAVWEDPELLPGAAEIADPAAWLARAHASTAR